MLENDLMLIRVSRVIPAQKWRVIRLVTKVEEFPSYISTVKEAVIIQKTRNHMKTKWRVQIDTVPISWVEEDALDLRANTIHFKAVEGDLDDFYGTWKFESHPDGTKVMVDVYVRVSIPAIKEFAKDYITKLVIRNFEAILESVEKRIVSTRYESYRGGNQDKIGGFGVIGHFYNFYHLEKCLKMLNPDFRMPSREFLAQLFHITPSFKLYDKPDFRSKTGETVNGCFIVATFIPDMIEKDMWGIFAKVVKACKIAEKHGVGIVTLGGFTSIVAERIGQEISQQVEVPVTTGNTFTAAMVIEGVLKAARQLDRDIGSLKVAIVGGTGDIGSACARVLAKQAKEVTITGRTKANLRKMNKELSRLRKARIVATTENERAVREADVVIAAASVSSSILEIDWFKPGAIICDVGYPKNISYEPTARKDILIFSGGLSTTPTPLSFSLDTGLPEQNSIYGCFAEAIILSLEHRYENYSFGRGNITAEKIDEIRGFGAKHGFEVAPFYWGDYHVDDVVLARVKEAGRIGV